MTHISWADNPPDFEPPEGSPKLSALATAIGSAVIAVMLMLALYGAYRIALDIYMAAGG